MVWCTKPVTDKPRLCILIVCKHNLKFIYVWNVNLSQQQTQIK